MTERTCQAVLTDIAAYRDGELAATECLTIDAHCGACPSCAALVAGLGETVGLCRGEVREYRHRLPQAQ